MDWLNLGVDLPEDPIEINDTISNELEIITSLGSDECTELAKKRFPSFRTKSVESRFGTKSRYSFRVPFLDRNRAIQNHLYRVFERQATGFKVQYSHR